MKSLKSKLILVIVSLTVVASLVTGAVGLITSINVSNDIIEEQSQTTLQARPPLWTSIFRSSSAP